MTDDDETDDLVLDDREDVTADEAIANAERVMDGLAALVAEFEQLTPEEQARLPESVRSFLRPQGIISPA